MFPRKIAAILLVFLISTKEAKTCNCCPITAAIETVVVF